MKLPNFPYELTICDKDGSPVPESEDGWVGLAHMETYQIKLFNRGARDAAVELKLDGGSIGTWALPAINSVMIDRPADVAKLLTFLKMDSPEAQAALQDSVSPDDRGLIQAVFRRGTIVRPQPQLLGFAPHDYYGGATRGGRHSFGGQVEKGIDGGSYSPNRGSSTPNYDSGGVSGLTGESRQTFGTVRFDEDASFTPVTLQLRLVHDANRHVAPDVLPLPARTPRSTPTPPVFPEPGNGSGRLS